VGPTTFAKLIRHFGSPGRALEASVSSLSAVEGIGPKKAEQIAASRNAFDVEAQLEMAGKLGVWMVTIEDERYPPPLKGIYDPPPVLYVKGTLKRQDCVSLAIVGSRRCSLYGREQAARFAHLLGSAGFTIVSGMARGIDTAAHQGALSAGTRTIAVQGCGLGRVYPPENRDLFGKIAESGACISELPLQTEPKAENFPPRNRIIAGLSLATIVVEARHRSGAMITARAALDNNREVMAVPGKVDSPFSSGPHLLIKEGARLLERPEDVTEALGHIGSQLREHVGRTAALASEKAEGTLFDISGANLTRQERRIYEHLGGEPVHLDELAVHTGLPAGAVSAALISLQLKTLVRQFPGNLFARR
jgi:DNA processing protein